MRTASIFLSTALATIQVMVVASSSTASARLRGLQGSTDFGLRKGHERITKRIGESHSGGASYGYGVEFQGSIPRDSKAKKQKSKKSNKSPKTGSKGQQLDANQKGASKKGKNKKKDSKGSFFKGTLTNNAYLGATAVPSTSPAVTSAPRQTLAPAIPTEVPSTQSPTFTASTTTPQTSSPTFIGSATTPPTTSPTVTSSTLLPAKTSPTSPPKSVPPTQLPIAMTSTPSTPPTGVNTPAPTSSPPFATTAPSSRSSSSIAQRILPYTLHGGDEFISSKSYQSKSLSFVESIPGVDNMTDAKVVQFYALGCIYFATFAVANPATEASLGKGVTPTGWISSTNWLNVTVDPCSGANSTITVWKGVGCEDNRVTRLNLRSNDLTGTFPPEIIILSADNPSKAGKLNFLDLSLNGNLFANNLESWMGMLGSNLEFLYFSATSFFSTNGVPNAISNLTSLKELDCSYSLLTGPLRDAPFRGLNNIDFLVLSGNAYNSTIPTVFRSLPNLQYLYLQNAFLSGDLSFARGLQGMQELWVDQNPGISGPVFSFFGELPSLQSLSLTDNSLTGTLPPEISKLTNMLSMWYYNNKLEGTFPQEWVSLTQLEKLEIEANTISGNLTNFCERLAPPSGLLTDLGADCMNLTACPCCTCCSLKQCNAIFRL